MFTCLCIPAGHWPAWAGWSTLGCTVDSRPLNNIYIHSCTGGSIPWTLVQGMTSCKDYLGGRLWQPERRRLLYKICVVYLEEGLWKPESRRLLCCKVKPGRRTLAAWKTSSFILYTLPGRRTLAACKTSSFILYILPGRRTLAAWKTSSSAIQLLILK